ncbi:MAG: 3-oxoacyl-ACP reductase family protein [Rhodospirillales bacterium]
MVIRLKGKIALITGASRGIGSTIAETFAAEGASVAVAYAEQAGKAEEVVGAITAAGGEAMPIRLDVRDRTMCRDAMAAVAGRYGAIDILVNNAGINRRATFAETTDQDWDDIMEVNLKGPFICCQEVFPHMVARGGGRIINISSVAGEYHGPKTVHYAVSKAGLNSLTKVVARYGAEHNILVNAVAPGIMLTDQTADELNSPAGQGIVAMTLLKRAGELTDVASTCVFLASDEQNYITAQVISVSGGAVL